MSVDEQFGGLNDEARFDWGVSRQRIDEAVRRIVETVHPLRVLAFGSWARGEGRSGSDLDLAVILDDGSNHAAVRSLYSALSGVSMSMDIVTASLEQHERFSKSVNSVHHDIARDGIVLYEREAHGSASRVAAA